MDKRILFVDSSKENLLTLKTVLAPTGYTILEAGSPENALEWLARIPVQIILTDHSYIGLLRKVREIYPDIIRIISSADTDLANILEDINQNEIFRYLLKPFKNEEVLFTLKEAFDQHEKVHRRASLIKRSRNQQQQLKRLKNRLEQVAEYRDHSSDLERQILEMIPFPVLVLSQAGEVLFVNRPFLSDFPSSLSESSNELLHGNIPTLIRCFKESPDPEIAFKVNGREAILMKSRLPEALILNGWIFVIKRGRP